jgi:hypothetical protein
VVLNTNTINPWVRGIPKVIRYQNNVIAKRGAEA